MRTVLRKLQNCDLNAVRSRMPAGARPRRRTEGEHALHDEAVEHA